VRARKQADDQRRASELGDYGELSKDISIIQCINNIVRFLLKNYSLTIDTNSISDITIIHIFNYWLKINLEKRAHLIH
jgi:hypothetical protein